MDDAPDLAPAPATEPEQTPASASTPASTPTPAQPLALAQPPVQPPAPAKRSSDHVPRWVWAMIAAVTLLTTAAGATLSITAIAALQNLPRTVVAQYLSDLEHGRAEAAMKLAGIRPNASDVLLSDAAYAKITDRIRSFTLQPAVTRGSKTTVKATITQGDRTYQRSFAVEPSGGLPGLPFWTLAPITPDTVDLKVNGPAGLTYTVAGKHPQSMPIGTAVTLRALPGTYPVKFSSSNENFEVWNADVTAAPAGGYLSPTEFNARLSSAGDAAGRRAIDAWLDACVASTEADPKNCPFYTFSQLPGVTITDVHWHLGTRPIVDLNPEWNSDGWEVYADSGSVSGDVDLLRSSDGATGTGTIDSIPVAFAGLLTFDGSGPLFVPLYTDGNQPQSGA
ncbi:hypothetical protein KNO15_20430 [Leifsonia shinshuensis]|uniref:hypothetical protein n=1 Tax=Leifsonia shinshuensis TaxID=150026 RepID=UPI001F51368A|nr:hypothetical protein [Leifsonia shinshuensis]MCI0159075.1 hypothetical protein [Leifsonia shinshuensis]